jgi:hypothetical protein
MMIEDVLNAPELKRKSDKKDVIWRIASLDNVETPTKIDPERV